MISVVIPLYNKEKQIAHTLQTVLSQTFQNFEIVIVNDGSSDNSVAEVGKFHDNRIKLIHQANAGVAAARNKGVEESHYDLIAFLDADDEWKPTYLETQYALFEKYPECSVFACNYEFKDAKGNVSKTIIKRLPFEGTDGILNNYFEVASCSHPPLWTSAIMVNKAAILDIGGFPIGIKSGEDLLTWARLAVKYKIAYSKIPLATFFFDTCIFNDDQKNRAPEHEDYVGEEFDKLLTANPQIKGLKEYNALWHKMRARIFLDKGFRKSALKECLKSIKYNISLKILIFMSMTILPQKVSQSIFNKIS